MCLVIELTADVRVEFISGDRHFSNENILLLDRAVRPVGFVRLAKPSLQ
nr:hypothetical protein TetV2_00280 [Oceanusvirus sp.]